jgi:MoxR-like ATPase
LAPEVKAEGPAAQPVPAAVQAAVQTMTEAARKKEGASGFFGRMAKLFDGSRKGQAAPEPALADYLQSAPELPLSPIDLLPAWARLSPAPAKPQLRFQLDGLEKWGAGAGTVRTLAVSESHQTMTGKDVPDTNGVVRKEWTLPAGAHGAVVSDTNLFYTDEAGRLAVLDLRTGDTKTYAASSGKVKKFLVTGAGEVYAVVDRRLERWRLKGLESTQISGDDFDAGLIGAMADREEDAKGTGFSMYFPGGRVRSSALGVEKYKGVLQLRSQDGAVSDGIVPAGNGLYFRVAGGKTTVWKGSNSSNDVEELGELPYRVESISRMTGLSDRGILVAVTAEGLVQWDLSSRRYRLFRIPGLEEAARRADLRVQGVYSSGDQVFLMAGERLLEVDIGRFADETTEADRVRIWSEKNPMSVKDGALRIGDFAFPIARKPAAPRPWYKRALDRVLGRTAPAEALDLGLSEKDWQAVNLPTNKRLIYDTLKGFTLNQHILYIGETGGGKTWIADKIAKLTGNELWMVSMNEYTRNKDLIARETFGEEGKNKTGLTMSTVLRWMTEGGILLLDEMHKPLEGIAVLNNILQNGEYRMPDGRIIKYDKKKSWVIGTMNPVKPPYKGEPPSGELSSRFGMTLEVKYLPADEEAALLDIFYSKVPRTVLEKLVAIANDLRKVYPDILPLPIAPRTLMHIVEHAARYPNDSIVDIFRKTYNPASIVEDPAIDEAILKVLEAHDLAGTGVKPAKAEPAPKPADDDVPF